MFKLTMGRQQHGSTRTFHIHEWHQASEQKETKLQVITGQWTDEEPNETGEPQKGGGFTGDFYRSIPPWI